MEVCRCAVGCVCSPGRHLTLNDLSSESETESEDEEVEYLNETNFSILSFCLLFLTRLKKSCYLCNEQSSVRLFFSSGLSTLLVKKPDAGISLVSIKQTKTICQKKGKTESD